MDYKSYFKTEGYNDVKLIEGFEKTIQKYPQLVEIILNSENALEVAEKLFENRKNIVVDLPPFMENKTIDKTQFFALAIQHSKDYDFIEKVIKTLALGFLMILQAVLKCVGLSFRTMLKSKRFLNKLNK